MNALSLFAALRLAITGPRYLRPTLADRARHAADSPIRAQPAAELTAAQWFAQLEEYLPRAFLYANACDLDQCRVVCGCTPAQAAVFAYVNMGAPWIAEPGTWYAPPVE